MTMSGCCRVTHLVIFQIFLLSVKGEHRLNESTKTIGGLLGREITLPCGLESEEDITGQGVEWARSDLNPKYVPLYRDKKFVFKELHPDFEGRTSMSLDRLKRGNMSLTITDLRFNDSGTFECILLLNNTPLPTKVHLEVGLVSEPQILHPVSFVDKLTLTCEAKDWKPKPEVEWKDSKEQTVYRDSNGTKENENRYYDIHSTFIGDITASESYVCIILQKETGHTRETKYTVPADVVRLKNSNYVVYLFMVTGWMALVILCGVMTFGYCTGRLSLKLQPDAGNKKELKDNALLTQNLVSVRMENAPPSQIKKKRRKKKGSPRKISA